jgi:hypothetical protein
MQLLPSFLTIAVAETKSHGFWPVCSADFSPTQPGKAQLHKGVLTTVLSPPPNKPHITLRITPLKISLIFLLEAIPHTSPPSNWLRSLALVCAGSGVIHSVMAVYSGGKGSISCLSLACRLFAETNETTSRDILQLLSSGFCACSHPSSHYQSEVTI